MGWKILVFEQKTILSETFILFKAILKPFSTKLIYFET